MTIDIAEDWSLNWEDDYIAQRQGERYELEIGEIQIPVTFQSPIIAIQISNFGLRANYLGYVLQRVGGTFPAYINESYRGYYSHNNSVSIFTFPALDTGNYYLSFIPIGRIKRMHLEVFEYTGT
jgi:hypothetical protein